MNWPDPPAAGPLGGGRYATDVDRPGTVDEARAAVLERAGRGEAVYPQGGRTALDYGGVPRTAGAILDTRGLGRVIDYPAADMTVTVEAGLTIGALAAVLDAEGQRLCVDAPRPGLATLGGVFATNTSGPRRFGAGRPRDQLIGVGFVTADGALVKGGGRVVKNVAGYDFPKLLTGSLGTLGVIVHLTLKVRPKPEASALVWAGVKDPARIGPALDRLNTSATRPMAVEVLNPPAAREVGGTVGDGQSWAIVVGFEDNAAAVAWQVGRLADEFIGFELTTAEGAEAARLWAALNEFPAAEHGPVSVLANLPPSAVAPFMGSLDPGRWASQAHAGNGIVRVHSLVDVGLDGFGPEVDRLRAAAVRVGGNLVLTRCPPDWHARLRVWGEPRPDWIAAGRVKHALDPLGVMNPGRFVGTI